jgi:ATP-binding cassette subfamily B protein
MPLDPQKHIYPFPFFLTVNRSEIKWFILNSLLYCIGGISCIIATYYLGQAIDSISIQNGLNVKKFLIFSVLFLLGYEVFYRLGHVIEIYIIVKIRSNIQKALFDHTSFLSFSYFTDRFAGEIAHKVTKLANDFEQMTKNALNNFIENGSIILFSMFALGMINFYFAGFIFLWTLQFIFISWWLAQELNRRASLYAKEEAATTGKIVDIYGNIAAFKVYGKEADLKTVYHQIDLEAKTLKKMGKWDVLTYHYHGTSIVLLSLGIIAITVWLFKKDSITMGSIVFISGTTLRLFHIIWETGVNSAAFIRSYGESSQNLKDIIISPAIIDGPHLVTPRENIDIEYKNLTFGYNHSHLVLKNFSLKIQSNQKVGIVGLSGAGKTTLANLLLRFFEPQEGMILLNRMNINDLSQNCLRSHISYISQDTSLFHTTITENIRYGSSIKSFDEIEQAAKLAYAHEFISTLPYGYESIVGERGIKLSGGQRQRIAIARALLANRPLFLLDEATSALDSDSEQKIQQGLAKVMEGKTVIAIAHRLSTLAHMDRIIFLENGSIIEDGTHESLILQNGKYAALWKMQAGGFLPDIYSL